MEFNELMATELSVLDTEQREFLRLHREIMANGNAAAVYAVEMARGLKEMRDSGKYRAAGFETFGEYAEAACGIKERQAYNYISVVENLSESFLKTNAQIGVSKLTLLASMNAGDRDVLIAEHGEELEDLSTRELDKLRKQYEARIQQMRFDFDKELKTKEQKIEQLKDDIEEIGAVDYKSDLKRTEDEKAELQAELDALRSAPPKVDEKAAAELEKKKEEVKKLKEAKAAAEKAASEAKERAEKEIAAAIEKERAAAKAIEKDLELERARLDAEAKKAKIAVDPLMSEFKARFGFWQEIGNSLLELVGTMETENAEKCKKAFLTIAEGWTK